MKKNIKTTHGAVEFSKSGSKKLSKFLQLTASFTDQNQYQAYLDNMPLFELQRYATTQSVIPSDDRDFLTRKLLKNFELASSK